MSQRLILELNDEIYAAIKCQAEVEGTSPADCAANALAEQYSHARAWHTAHPQREEARQRFERHFGEVDLGHATGVNNEDIDEDLARAYVDTHEER